MSRMLQVLARVLLRRPQGKIEEALQKSPNWDTRSALIVKPGFVISGYPYKEGFPSGNTRFRSYEIILSDGRRLKAEVMVSDHELDGQKWHTQEGDIFEAIVAAWRQVA